jgi:hypothetical protein
MTIDEACKKCVRVCRVEWQDTFAHLFYGGERLSDAQWILRSTDPDDIDRSERKQFDREYKKIVRDFHGRDVLDDWVEWKPPI